MKKTKLIKRKREIIIEITPESSKSEGSGYCMKGSSITVISRKIDIFEGKIRRKMESEMRIFSSDTHSQEFLRSLIPSFNKDRKC